MIIDTGIKVAISQPTYLSWVGYFEQISRADVFVFLDSVQFEKQSWQSRNRIKDNADNPIWLSVPVKKNSLQANVADIEISQIKPHWYKKHLNSIQTYLGKTPHLSEIMSLLSDVYDKKHTHLSQLNIDLITAVCEKLELDTVLLKSSDLQLTGYKSALLVNILEELNATTYLANAGSKAYLDLDNALFKSKNIEICYQDWIPPYYKQKNGSFTPYLAWVDAVAYQGFNAQALFANSTDQIRSG